MKNTMHLPFFSRRAAFTLVEMSVVLVIIGLIVGVVVEGASMIHNSQLQSVTNDFTKFGTAYNQFKQMYGGQKPGDFYSATGQKATDVWGAAAGTSPAYQDAPCFAATTVSSPATCNGDGNGYIGGPYVAGALTNVNEVYITFQQLKNAKMIDGNYSGNPTGGANFTTNVPAGALDSSAYMFVSQAPVVDAGTSTNSPYSFYGNYGSLNVSGTIKPGTYMVIGSIGSAVSGSAASSLMPENELMSPVDAYYIDRKIDDGLPGTGLVMSYYAYPDGTAIGATQCLLLNSGTAVASNISGIAYNTTITGPVCNLLYVNDVIVN